MTYDMLKLDDYQILDVLDLARRHGALVMVHAENNDMIKWIAKRLLGQRPHRAQVPRREPRSAGRKRGDQPRDPVVAAARHADPDRACLGHRRGRTPSARPRCSARRCTAKPARSTCSSTASDIDRPGLDGAMFCCSPPPRDEQSQEAIWEGLANGTFQVFSSDHAPYRFDESGKLPKGDKTTFKDMANGVPGLELRLPLLFSEGVGKDRLTLNQFVALTATNHARIYGLDHCKGTHRGRPGRRHRAVGSGARDDHHRRGHPRQRRLHALRRPHHHRLAGRRCSAAGARSCSEGRLHAERGSGQFVARRTPGPFRIERKTSDRFKLFASLVASPSHAARG